MNRAELKLAAKSQIKGNIGILFLISLVISLICALVAATGIGAILNVLVLTPAFSLATTCIYLNLAKGVVPQFKDAFGKFNEFWGAFKVIFLQGLFVSLWSLLFVIPGIVKSFSYAMALYIYAENPGMGACECITRSRAMMKGHKMELFVLGLSFFGWILLSMITFGIALIWVAPYMQATMVNFYNKIKTPVEVVG